MTIIEIPIPEYNDVKSARQAIQYLMNQTDTIEAAAEQIADEHGVTISAGDYGYGRTYYPAGYKGSWLEGYEGVELDEDEKLTEGVWLSSSDMC